MQAFIWFIYLLCKKKRAWEPSMLQKREHHHTRIGNPILGSRATTLRSVWCNTVTTDNRELRCLHAAPTYGPTSRARYPFIFSFHFYSFTFHNNKCYYFLAYLFFSFPGFSFYLLLYMKFSWQLLYRNHTKKICTYKLCD